MPDRKVVLITGSGKRRVGSFVSDAFGARGYALALHYRTSQDEAEASVERYRAQGIEAVAFPADLTDERATRGLVKRVREQFGRIDVLVNSAAIWQSKSLETVTADDVRKHFETNTLGTFLCCQAAGLAMVQQETGGCIVNLGDWADARPYLDFAAYFPSKAAIPGLTRCFAVELGTRNPRVRVNCVLPGPVMLPSDMDPAEREAVIDATLVKREGSPAHIAQAVLFLVDNEFVTGVSLPVDGGRSIYAPFADAGRPINNSSNTPTAMIPQPDQ